MNIFMGGAEPLSEADNWEGSTSQIILINALLAPDQPMEACGLKGEWLDL